MVHSHPARTARRGGSRSARRRTTEDPSDSASRHLGLAPSRTGENLRKPGRDLGDAACILNSLAIQSPWDLAASQTLWRGRS